MKRFLQALFSHGYLIILAIVFAFLYLYRLDYNTLASWDEAWYATIARNIVQSGDIFNLTFNDKPFFDHPPMGFWIMALFFRLFGVGELTARLPSALMGIGSVLLVYFIANRVWRDRTKAFAAGLVLGTCVWFVLRARSGNLDVPFVFFYLLTILSGYVYRDRPGRWWLLPLSLGALVLTKTLVGLSAVPLVIMIIWPTFRKKEYRRLPYLSLGLLLLVVLPWYLVQILSHPGFVNRHFLEIGTRNRTFLSYFELKAEEPLFYLHMGVRKWYYLWLLSLGIIGVSFAWLKREVQLFLVWNFLVLYPFLTSEKTELWHLIPVYLPLSFLVAYGLDSVIRFGQRLFGWVAGRIWPPLKLFTKPVFAKLALILVVVSLAVIQVNGFVPEVIPMSRYVPDDVKIARRAARYRLPIYLDDDYFPLAAFYSGKTVESIGYLPDERKRDLVGFYRHHRSPFVIIVRHYAPDNLKAEKIRYRVLEKNPGFSILSR